MRNHGTKIKLTVALAVTVVASLGLSSPGTAKPKPSPGCTAKLVSIAGSEASSLQLYRWTLCGRGVGPAFG